MNTRHTLIAIGAAAALTAGGYAIYQVGMHRGMGQAGGAATPASGSAVTCCVHVHGEDGERSDDMQLFQLQACRCCVSSATASYEAR